MEVADVELDDKAKRTRDLLSSFYSPDSSAQSNASFNHITLDSLNTSSFDPDQYMNLLVRKSNLEGLIQRHVEMAAEIKNIDTDLQMLVYENYNKFIGATDTIKRMKSNIVGMETNMEQLLEKIRSVQSRSDGVNTSLFEKREHIEKVHRRRNLLQKIQVIYDLPTTLEKCMKSEAYSDAVRFYTGALPIFKAFGDSSFSECKKASEEAVGVIAKELQKKLFSEYESIQVRAESALLLNQLDFSVESLKRQLFDKLEELLARVELKEVNGAEQDPAESFRHMDVDSNCDIAAHEASFHEFVQSVRAYRVIFPDTEGRLSQLSHDLVTKQFESVIPHQRKHIYSADLIKWLGVIWADVLMIDEVLPDAALPTFMLDSAKVAVQGFITNSFSNLLIDVSGAVTNIQDTRVERLELMLKPAIDASRSVVHQGSLDMLQDFQKFLSDDSGAVMKLKPYVVDWVQEGLQEFFLNLDGHFLMLSEKRSSSGKVLQDDRILTGMVLVLSQLSIFIEKTVIPKITEEIAASFSGVSARGYERGPPFIPSEMCRMFHSSGEKLLHRYVKLKTQRISLLLRKRFMTPNWAQHKEPREVHMFVDLFLHELEAVANEARQVLPQGLVRRHRRSDSSESAASSRSIPRRDGRIGRSRSQRSRSDLIETHLAKLFKQKIEIFTKLEFTQDWVINTTIRLCLKSMHEYVRLQTMNRRGFQQIQLDVQFLRTPLKQIFDDETTIDFLLDEVIVAAAERCLEPPTPLELPILDKLIQSKLSKPSNLHL